MAGYIGHKPTISNYTVDEFTTSSAQASSGNFTLSQTVSDSKTLEISVGGIDQPQSAYTISGTTLAFGASVVTLGDIVIARQAGESISYPGGLEDGAVTEAKIGSGAVTDAKIGGMASSKLTGALPAISGASLTNLPVAADNSITLAKMAGGTDGQIITYSAAGDPVAIGPGTAGQVLTSAGPNLPQTFADAGGGGFIRLGGATFNGVTTVTINPSGFDMEYNVATGYDSYKLYFSVFTATNAQYVQMRTSRDNGSSWLTSGYNFNINGRHAGSDKNSDENGDSKFYLTKPKTSDNNALARQHFEITMYKNTYEVSYFTATIIFAGQVGVNSGATWSGTGSLCSAYTEIDALQLLCTSGNIDGNWTMYGLKS